MPKELPRPISTTAPRKSHGEIARRHRHRVEAIKRRIRIEKRVTRDSSHQPNTSPRQKQALLPSTRLSLSLFENPFSAGTFLPCPSFVGPFSIASSFRRVSQGLKPFVQLPIRAEAVQEYTDQISSQSRIHPADTDSESDSDTEPYSQSTINDLDPLSPLPWSPLQRTPVATDSKNKRSSTLLSTCSTSTSHVSMFDMYSSGKLVSQYAPLPSSKPTGVVKKHNSHRNRKSTLARGIISKHFSNGSTDTTETFITAPLYPRIEPTTPSNRYYTLPVSRTSTCLASTKARGSVSPPPSKKTATQLLHQTLDKYGLPTPPPSPSLMLSADPNSILIMPEPLRQRADTFSTLFSEDTTDTPLDDAYAVLNRSNASVVRSFNDGYWSWSRVDTASQQRHNRPEVSKPPRVWNWPA